MEFLMLLGPFGIAFLLGIMVGWAWKPRWASMGFSKFDFSSAPPSPSKPLIMQPVVNPNFGSTQSCDSSGVANTCFEYCHLDNGADGKAQFGTAVIEKPNQFSSSSNTKKEEDLVVTEEDLKHLCLLVEKKDGGPSWKHMMDRSTPSMTYQAWQRDPETGPPQYCSKTVYEDATPEILRDFFWDDEFRSKWDDMLLHASTIEECPATGTAIVHWIRKFPFFCSDRDYTIGRRIWESGRMYYCVTKGVPCPSVPRQQKPRRVDLYYSSWFIHSVGSNKGTGRPPACEVIFFHHEDMGIPWEIAKFGVRQGMWGAARKVERGLRMYQKERASAKLIPPTPSSAHIRTKIDPDYLHALESSDTAPDTSVVGLDEKPGGINVPKLLVIGGAILFACSIDRGLLTRTVIFGVARRFANLGKRAADHIPRT